MTIKEKLCALHHIYVPLHVLLTKEEAKRVCKKYKINAFQLPKMNVSDPISILLGAKPGDIMKIIRRSPTAGLTTAYRHVIA